MECHNHPDREAVTNCSLCGKAICQDCSMEIAGQVYCKDCVNEIVTKSLMEKAVKESAAAPAETVVEEKADYIEPVETITPIQAEEEVIEPVEKAPENYETDYEYETEYVETYEEDGAEDSYYENPEIIPEPEPEYREHAIEIEKESKAKQAPIEPIHTEDIDKDYYEEPIHAETPNKELEAKYERYLEDLYYDEEEPPRARAPRGRRRPRPQEYDDYREAPRRGRPQRYPEDDRGEYYINPRDEGYEEEYIVPSHNRNRRSDESYEELKRRIERNYEREQQAKKRGRLRRSRKPKYDYDELENIQEMHRFPEEEESESLSITEIILAVILILLILMLILYVIYLFRLSGDYVSFFEALSGLVTNPGEFITNVMN